MIALYRILFLPLFVFALPYYMQRMWRRRGYGVGLRYRLGFFDALNKPASGKKRLWLQAVSVGELHALKTIIEHFRQRKDIELVITVTTTTAYKLLQERYAKDAVQIGLLPLDFWPCSWLAWTRLKVDMAVLMDGDLWPEHIHQAYQRKVPIVLINARMSDRSFARYARVPILMRWLLGKITAISASNMQDYERLKYLGANQDTLSLSGNLKFDVTVSPILTPDHRESLKQSLGLGRRPGEANEPLILIGASTWPGEETMLIQALQDAHALGIACRLILAPRHPERRASIQRLCQGLSWHLRSQGPSPKGPVDVYIADTMGELQLLMQLADLAFIGKSLPPHIGGQTPIDAAALGVPMVYGPNMSNFRLLAESLDACGAAVRVQDTASAQASLIHLLQDACQRQTHSKAAKQWHVANQGAASKTLACLERILQKTQ